MREIVKALHIVCVPSWPVAELSQQMESSFCRNIHLCLHLEAQHGLLLEGVKLNLATVKQAKPSAAHGNHNLYTFPHVESQGNRLFEGILCPSRR